MKPLEASAFRRAGLRLWERYLRYLTKRERLRPWNRVTPYFSGEEAFAAMLAAISAGKHSVHLEIYIWADDHTGRRFRDVLAERARSGCKVRVIYDALGSFALSDRFLEPLRSAGAVVLPYAPLLPWRRNFGLNQRDHQKILVVDDAVAFAGGLNLTDEYMPVERGGAGWYDTHARVEGLAVRDLAMLFRRTWIKSGGDRFEEPPPASPVLPRGGASVPGVQVFSNVWMRSRSHMRQAYLRAIRRSERSIHIMNAYFIPDRGLRRAFALAAARGVEVHVIVPSRSDVPAVGHATRRLYARLLKSGVRIHEWPGPMMHAKTGVIDGIWSTIGSYNLDKRSFLHNLEVGLIIVDTQIGETMDRRFEEARALSREIRLEEWEQRGWWQRTKEWCCYQLRYWL